MKKIATILIALSVALVVAVLVLWDTFADITTLPSEDGPLNLPLDEGRSYVCISSQYEIPDMEIQKYIDGTCWGGNEVPVGSTYITQLKSPNKCNKFRIDANFISGEPYGTRCFTKNEIDGYNLIIRSGIIEMEQGQYND
ncbi:hypothetical protein [Paracoccus methylarcula]|uniref:hypothetical protein n=1 Tax=Paracoccus methylarcula TaxID=72022 RepID=UPI0011CDB40D|nr:hypothetical protein [Paracoccus methylarcula]